MPRWRSNSSALPAPRGRRASTPSCRSGRPSSARTRRSDAATGQDIDMQTIGELLERNERFYPHKEALVFEDRRHTYRTLLSRVKQLADGLHRIGLRRQDRVAILAMNCMEYLELLSAGDWAGFIVSTLNFRLAVPELEWIARDSAPRVL